MTEALSFDALRPWEGEQSRAFEELTFQLFKADVPTGTSATRTGNPDGGVEWYARLEDGTETGWQAKHVKGIDALLTAMTDSVKRVAKERPSLHTLNFVVSWNLSTGTRGGERKSQRQKYEDKVRAWKESIAGASRIQFNLIQGSDVLDRLAGPVHRGRIWFWWDHAVLSPQWLKQRYNEEAEAAGDKYRPDLQVDLPIQEDLLALGFDSSSLAQLYRICREIVSCAADVSVWTRSHDDSIKACYIAVNSRAGELKETARNLDVVASDPSNSIKPLLEHAERFNEAVAAVEDYETGLERAWEVLSADARSESPDPPQPRSNYGVQNLKNAIYELHSWLATGSGRMLQQRAYFLTGRAGSGKTHLLLDATRRALDDERPALFLSGARFGRSDLWGSVSDQLGLPQVGADVLLGAMDAAGEAASIVGRRFVLCVDALNETAPPDFWTSYLPALRSKIAQYSHIALVVSCRDTYRDLVLDDVEHPNYFHRSHPGFSEREVEATQRYFNHYGLEAPKIPLLTPEFALPLFLRLYSESMANAGPGEDLLGHQGRVAIFERYLRAKISTVARRYRPTSTSTYEVDVAKKHVQSALEFLLDEMSRAGRESIPSAAAETAVRTALEGSGGDPNRVLGLLQEEGILTRERLYLRDGKYEEGVRIVFQAFSDFLLLKRRLDISSDPLNDKGLRTWLRDDCSWGIIEAATVVFPEIFEVELPDLLGISLLDSKSRDDDDTWKRARRGQHLYRSLVEALPYRASGAITQRTIDLLNDAQRFMSRADFYNVLFTIAPQPDNRLNGDGLHRYLARFRMPRRDSDFGFATYAALSDEFGPAARLARWAAEGPYPTYDARVIELSSIPLCWLFSSPNRFMRDWVTKALVQLLSGHLDVMRTLFSRFWNVDDPYVVQRVLAVAHGALLRSSPSQAEQARELARAVSTAVFAHPVRADELLLDSARGIVRWAVTHDLLPSSALDTLRRPYGIKPPGSAPSIASLEDRYRLRDDLAVEESYTSIFYSVFHMGDFGRYVIESGLDDFSRYRLGQDRPNRADRHPRLVKVRWEAFVRSLTAAQRNELADQLNDMSPSSFSPLHHLRRRSSDPLTAGQRQLLDAAWVYPKIVSDEYPKDHARRWVFRRTLSLGWSPEIFGEADRTLGHGRGREGHKAERWGKKYQWMAYHELLAKVADNFQSSLRYSDSSPYEGLHQIVGEREIDPSLPPVDFAAFKEGDGSADVKMWEASPVTLREWPTTPIDFRSYRSEIHRFLADTDSEPAIGESVVTRDLDNEEWIVLDGWMNQVDPLSDKSWSGIQQKVVIDTLLVPADQGPRLLSVLSGKEHRHVSDLADAHGHTDCCFVGEIGRSGPNCYHKHDRLESTVIEGESFDVVSAVEGYAWEGSILDCSIENTATTILPSTYIQQSAELTFDVCGPSWRDSVGNPVFVHYERPESAGRALLVSAPFLRSFLATRGLELLIMHWFERMELKGEYSPQESHPYIESSGIARMDADLTIHVGSAQRRERDLESG